MWNDKLDRSPDISELNSHNWKMLLVKQQWNFNQLEPNVPGVRRRPSPEAAILFSRATKHALTFVPITFTQIWVFLQIIQMIKIPLQLQDIFSLYNNYNMPAPCLISTSSFFASFFYIFLTLKPPSFSHFLKLKTSFIFASFSVTALIL